MKIAKETIVSLDYTLKNDAGEVMDTSEGREPLTYLHGVGSLIPGLEKVLNDKEAGEKLTVKIEPEEAYGKRNEALIQEVELKQFEEPKEIKEGVQIQVETSAGANIAVVTKLENEMVTLDMNHPLADMTLHFDVEVKAVREATKEEIEHGHVHGPEGHEH